MDLIVIGNRIKQKRNSMKITRDELAEKVGISTKFCADIESGQKGFSINTLVKISKVLCVTTDYILFGASEGLEIKNISNMLSGLKEDKILYVEEIIKILVQSYEDK